MIMMQQLEFSGFTSENGQESVIKPERVNENFIDFPKLLFGRMGVMFAARLYRRTFFDILDQFRFIRDVRF